MIQNIWDNEKTKINLAVHTGMRMSRPGYCFESQAFKKGYEQVGDDGKYYPSRIAQAGGSWEELPEVLKPDFDLEGTRSKIADRMPVNLIVTTKRKRLCL